MKNGHIGLFRTKGNPYVHIVLRGGGVRQTMTERASRSPGSGF